jgi:predicted lipoprotein with Yx(FWY)xxD motif
MRKIMTAVGLAAAVLAVAACGSSSSSSGTTPAAGTSSTPAAAGASSPAASASGSTLMATTIGGKQVLTNAGGFTLYSFAPDTPTTSKCYGSCAAYWPPVTGTAAASPGLPGRIATITRTGGARQLTYNGHPLYTYIGDSAPGQAKGNNLNLNGGLWHEVPVSR